MCSSDLGGVFVGGVVVGGVFVGGVFVGGVFVGGGVVVGGAGGGVVHFISIFSSVRSSVETVLN